jgi:RsiW-degrading membrane proteinase PrsW (M82 family)
MLGALVGLGARLGEMPAVIVAAALVPALGFAALVLFVGRRVPASWAPVATALLWGGTVAALAAFTLNEAALGTVPELPARALVPRLVAPIVEELSKASALAVVALAWSRRLASVRDGIVYGALAGLGFAATENLGYYTLAAVQGGAPGLARALYIRGVLQGLNHAAFTAATGAAVGAALGQRRASRAARAGIVIAGLALAVAVHAAWNALGSEVLARVLCGAPVPEAPCAPAPHPIDLLVTAPVVVATITGPLVVLLLGLVLREPRDR